MSGDGAEGLRSRVRRRRKLYSLPPKHKKHKQYLMLPRTSRFQSRPAVSAGHTSCWITERSGLPQKGTDRQVNDKTCEDKTIYSQRVVDTETYMGDGEWATGGESQLVMSAHLLHDRHRLPNPRAVNITRQQGEPRRHPEPWQYPPPQGRLLASPEDSPWRWWNWSMRARSRMSRAGIQHLSSGPYPSQSTRYW